MVVFSTDRSKWFTTSRFLRLARPTEDGSFEVTSLPPGEYWVAATDPVDGNDVSGDWLKPESLEKLSFRATARDARRARAPPDGAASDSVAVTVVEAESLETRLKPCSPKPG